MTECKKERDEEGERERVSIWMKQQMPHCLVMCVILFCSVLYCAVCCRCCGSSCLSVCVLYISSCLLFIELFIINYSVWIVWLTFDIRKVIHAYRKTESSFCTRSLSLSPFLVFSLVWRVKVKIKRKNNTKRTRQNKQRNKTKTDKWCLTI